MKNKYLFKIVLTSLLIALNVIMERFVSYNVWNMSIGFSFITIVFAAVFLGVPYAVAVGTFGDIIGALLFPFGTYFFGFTLTNILMAFTTGIFLYRKVTIVNTVVSVFIKKIAFTVLLNSLWIAILYRGGIDAIWAVAVGRIPMAFVTFFIEVIITYILFNRKSKLYYAVNKLISK